MSKNKKIIVAVVASLAAIGALVVAKEIKNALSIEDEDDVKAWSSSFFMPGYEDTDTEN